MRKATYDLYSGNNVWVCCASMLIEVATTRTNYYVRDITVLATDLYMWPNFQVAVIGEPVPGSGVVAVAFEGNNLSHAVRLDPTKFFPRGERDEIQVWAVQKLHEWVIANAKTVPPVAPRDATH